MSREYKVIGIGDDFVAGYDSEDGEDFVQVLVFDNPFIACDAAEFLQTWHDAGGMK